MVSDAVCNSCIATLNKILKWGERVRGGLWTRVEGYFGTMYRRIDFFCQDLMKPPPTIHPQGVNPSRHLYASRPTPVNMSTCKAGPSGLQMWKSRLKNGHHRLCHGVFLDPLMLAFSHSRSDPHPSPVGSSFLHLPERGRKRQMTDDATGAILTGPTNGILRSEALRSD